MQSENLLRSSYFIIWNIPSKRSSNIKGFERDMYVPVPSDILLWRDTVLIQ